MDIDQEQINKNNCYQAYAFMEQAKESLEKVTSEEYCGYESPAIESYSDIRGI